MSTELPLIADLGDAAIPIIARREIYMISIKSPNTRGRGLDLVNLARSCRLQFGTFASYHMLISPETNDP